LIWGKIYTLLIGMLWFGSSAVFAQQIRGTITDENKEPMPGVSVVIKGTTTGTVSDLNGKV
jgi:hypothetical protein